MANFVRSLLPLVLVILLGLACQPPEVGPPDPEPPHSCFAAGTLIETPEGERAIESLRVGDVVWAYDHQARERVPSRVLHAMVHQGARVRRIGFATGGSVEVTDSHPFFTDKKHGYVAAGKLEIGMSLLAGGDQPAATSVAFLAPVYRTTTVYNIEVEAQHNYFAAGVLVHNKSRPLPPIEPPPPAPNTFDNPPLVADGSRPALTGGTLATNGEVVVVADPARDTVFVADIDLDPETGAVAINPRAEIALEVRDEPSRVLLANGHAYVSLRRGGAIVDIDLELGEQVGRFEICAAPRGLDWDSSRERLLVACAGGELVALRSTGEVLQRKLIEPDLRDVVVAADGRVFVSLFRAAEVLVLRDEVVEDRWQVPRVSRFTPRVAWRMRGRPDGEGVYVLSQEHRDDHIVESVTPTGEVSWGSPQMAFDPVTPCADRLVRTVFASLDAQGARRFIFDAPLAVDFDTSEDGALHVVSAAVSAGHRASRPVSAIRILELSHLDVLGGRLSGCAPVFHHVADPNAAPYTSVAALESDSTLVFSRKHATLFTLRPLGPEGTLAGVPLAPAEEWETDTALDIFHADTGVGLACASCHPEGREDGHVWAFGGHERRTQTLVGGVMATAPFHWAGDQRDLGEVMSSTFTSRMIGPQLMDAQVAALGDWLDELPTVPSAVQDEAAVARGETAFNEMGCADCHSGPLGTNNETVAVGVERFQVPALFGVGTRAPYFHDGCATGFDEVFGGCAGTPREQHVFEIDEETQSDLVAYLLASYGT